MSWPFPGFGLHNAGPRFKTFRLQLTAVLFSSPGRKPGVKLTRSRPRKLSVLFSFRGLFATPARVSCARGQHRWPRPGTQVRSCSRSDNRCRIRLIALAGGDLSWLDSNSIQLSFRRDQFSRNKVNFAQITSLFFNWHSQIIIAFHPIIASCRLCLRSRILFFPIFSRQYERFDLGNRRPLAGC